MPADIDRHFVGDLHGAPCFAVDADQLAQLPPGAVRTPLTVLQRELDPVIFTLASGAVQLIAWTHTSRFCGRCGTGTVRSTEHRAYACPACGLLAFPRLAPAVIVLIESGDRILLARSPTFPEPSTPRWRGLSSRPRRSSRPYTARYAKRWGWRSATSVTSQVGRGHIRTPCYRHSRPRPGQRRCGWTERS